MILGRVCGKVVCTRKDTSYTGLKLLAIEELSIDKKTPTGRHFVAADTMGAGTSDHVIIAEGDAARMARATKQAPVDAIIVAIVDSLVLEEASNK